MISHDANTLEEELSSIVSSKGDSSPPDNAELKKAI